MHKPHTQTRFSDVTPTQWKAGIAAWLGWLFDGLDMHLYTLIALPFVAQLLHVSQQDQRVNFYSSWIQAAFMVGWALGGALFGRLGDRIGRSRALVLTILTYALFTGAGFLAQEWWHLLVFRFLAALGIGGEWAVGAALLAETWPKGWRYWLAAVLQTGVNIGVLLAGVTTHLMAELPYRSVFLVGLAPALITLWIRRAVPETDDWHAAKHAAGQHEPGIADLFRGDALRTTLLTMAVCALSLSGHWGFVFWQAQHVRRLPEVVALSADAQTRIVSDAWIVLMLASIVGNFLAAGIARRLGYKRTIALMAAAYFLTMMFAYGVPRTLGSLWWCFPLLGLWSGFFALFTMYLPPLFPTLLRTTGAGFCYNIGRIASAAGIVVFGLVSPVGDQRVALVCAGVLFLPAALIALAMPDGERVEDSPNANDGTDF
ncbi:MAG: MFS transporter [Planctomycetaceae bacterium]|nr:MFS transporter [Planctomycetaceae bacterium]